MGATAVKLFNDTNTGYVVCSLTFGLDLDYFPLITASIDHNGTNIQLNVNNCGKEVCFLREHAVNQQQLILIQHSSMFSAYSHTLGIGIEISRQNSMFFIYNLKEDGPIPHNSLITHTVPDIQVYNYRPSSVTYDPANENYVNLFRSQLQTTLGDLGNVDSIPRASFQNVLQNFYDVPIKCVAHNKNKTLLCNTSLDLANNQINDGTLQTNYRMKPTGSRRFWRIFIMTANEVYPNTQTKPSPTLTIHVNMNPRKDVNLVLLHSSFEIIFSFWEGRKSTVRIYKLVNGKPVRKFSGFKIGVAKFREVLRVMFTTYNVLQVDAGMYVVTVSTAKQTVSRNFTVEVYKRKLEVFEMTATNYTKVSNGLNVTCRAAGNPRPKIEFYQQVFGEDHVLIYENYPKLESNDKFTILPEVRDKDEMTSRSILVKRFPGNASATHSFTIDCKAFTKYQEEHTTHHIYKYFWGY